MGVYKKPKYAVIFIGIPASGKSTFYREQYSDYVHINLDTLHTRNKENILLDDCFRKGLSFVVDNTNPTVEDRAKYISTAKDKGYHIIGYYFRSSVFESLERNNLREGKAKVSDVAVKSIHSKTVLPTFSEGFDELYYVSIQNGQFIIAEWQEE